MPAIRNGQLPLPAQQGQKHGLSAAKKATISFVLVSFAVVYCMPEFVQGAVLCLLWLACVGGLQVARFQVVPASRPFGSALESARWHMQRKDYRQAHTVLRQCIDLAEMGDVFSAAAECAFQMGRHAEVKTLAIASNLWQDTVPLIDCTAPPGQLDVDSCAMLEEAAKLHGNASCPNLQAALDLVKGRLAHAQRFPYVWQYVDDSGKWVDMCAKLCCALEIGYQSFQADPSVPPLVLDGRVYDFAQMQQRNVGTARTRQLRRFIQGSGGGIFMEFEDLLSYIKNIRLQLKRQDEKAHEQEKQLGERSEKLQQWEERLAKREKSLEAREESLDEERRALSRDLVRDHVILGLREELESFRQRRQEPSRKLFRLKSRPLMLFEDDALTARVQKILVDTAAAHNAPFKGQVSKCQAMSQATIRRVRRVVNPTLWNRYDAKRREIGSVCNITPVQQTPALQVLQEVAHGRLGGQKSGQLYWIDCNAAVNEVLLFHGTQLSNAEKIAETGFDNSRISFGLYGKGFYFACESCKSFQYTGNGGTPSGGMVICRVVLGQPTYVRSQHNNASSGEVLDSNSHSAVVLPGPLGGPAGQQHQEFVVFHASQVFPEFIVEFEGV